MFRSKYTLSALLVLFLIVVGLTTTSTLTALLIVAAMITIGIATLRHKRTLPPLPMAFLMLLFVAPVLAQGSTPSAPSLPPLDMNALAMQFMVFILGLLSSFISSPATVALVSWLKRVPALDRYPSTTLATGTAAVLMVVLALAVHFGVEGQFRSIVDVITAILTTLGGMSINLTSSTVLYNVAKAQNVSMIGYSRSTTTAQKAAMSARSAP